MNVLEIYSYAIVYGRFMVVYDCNYFTIGLFYLLIPFNSKLDKWINKI